MSDWISVKDRLPEEWQRVIVCDANAKSEYEDEDVSEATFAPCGKGCCEPQFETKGLEYISHNDVTHWMPFPKPPKGDNDVG